MNRSSKPGFTICKWIVPLLFIRLSLLLTSGVSAQTQERDQQQWCTYEGKIGPGVGKHIVFISGDDEYRSEQPMPMLGKILAVRHGFKCTVLFAIDPDSGTIKPNHQTNIPGMEAIDSADLLILGLRFRNLPDDQMKHFVDYHDAGKPMIGTRTTTHAFNYPKDSTSAYKHFAFNSEDWAGGFGQQVMGNTWVNHHGVHGKQSSLGIIPDDQKDNLILKGVKDVWGPSDVYGIKRLPETAKVLLKGAVLSGMSPDDKPIFTIRLQESINHQHQKHSSSFLQLSLPCCPS